MTQAGENYNALSGISLLVFIQLVSRLCTFIANQLILRALSPAILGAAAQLELYLISILYFSRESVRIAIQRQPLGSLDTAEDGKEAQSRDAESQSVATQSIVNMSYLSLGLGFPISLAFAAFYIYFSSEIIKIQFYHVSVVLTTVSAVAELCSEPHFVVIQQRMLYKKRAAVEMAAAFMKSLAICGAFAWSSWTGHSVGVLPFALGYLCFSLTLVCGYRIVTKDMKSRVSFFLNRVKLSDKSKYLAHRFPRHLVSLSAAVFLQSVVKHLLTQGDCMILATMASLEDQGIYSLASNYGGLLARILFQPIEESSRAIFSTLLNSNKTEDAKGHLLDVLRGYGMLSAMVLSLGPYIVPLVLHILGGRRWASADVDSLLSLYCYYIPLLAFNGVTEAFVSSAASPSEFRNQTTWMGAFSTFFAMSAYLFLKIGNLGANGLVFANIVNMTIRTAWSLWYIRSYLQRHGIDFTVTEFSPRMGTYIGATVTSFTLARQESDFSGILRAAVFTTIYGLLVLYIERRYFQSQYTKLCRIHTSKTLKAKEA